MIHQIDQSIERLLSIDSIFKPKQRQTTQQTDQKANSAIPSASHKHPASKFHEKLSLHFTTGLTLIDRLFINILPYCLSY